MKTYQSRVTQTLKPLPNLPFDPCTLKSTQRSVRQSGLDVVFGEDDSRIRQGHSARNMSLMRRFTLNLLRQETSKASLTMKRYKAAMDNDFLLKILDDSGFI